MAFVELVPEHLRSFVFVTGLMFWVVSAPIGLWFVTVGAIKAILDFKRRPKKVRS